MRSMENPQAVADWLRARVKGALQVDSRLVAAGDGFVAWPGAATDGRRFVASALQAGAAAALVEQAGVDAFAFQDERVVAVPGLKALAGAIASAFHGDPSMEMDVVAITGTNGKTSTAWWLAQLLSATGRPCAVAGTLGIGHPPLRGERGAALQPTGLTTPDPVLWQSRMRQLADAGVRACAIEASSIGLVEGRLNATRVAVAVFTNFTQDHLDFHGSMEAYWAAKASLFEMPGLAHAVVHVGDARGAGLARQLSQRSIDLWTVNIEAAAVPGLASEAGAAGEQAERGAEASAALAQAAAAAVPRARLFASEPAVVRDGLSFSLGERNAAGAVIERHEMVLPLVGRYNLSNMLCVFAAARALGVPLADAVHACQRLTPVPGRMERVEGPSAGPVVLVDYAHTPDALEKALQALRPWALQRGGALWALAGCGGNRDASKRPLMAAVAERESDHVVLTSDNPRHEDPAAILAQMVAGLARPARALVEPDRGLAIRLALQRAAVTDVVLLAGKGHEETQEVMGEKRPFSDREHARTALLQRASVEGAGA